MIHELYQTFRIRIPATAIKTPATTLVEIEPQAQTQHRIN